MLKCGLAAVAALLLCAPASAADLARPSCKPSIIYVPVEVDKIVEAEKRVEVPVEVIKYVDVPGKTVETLPRWVMPMLCLFGVLALGGLLSFVRQR
jgi:hypothetical protein